MPELELASYEEIATELAKRSDVVVLLATRPAGTVGNTLNVASTIHGNTFTALGMLGVAHTVLTQQILETQQKKKGEDSPCP